MASVFDGEPQIESELFRYRFFTTTIDPNSFRLMVKWIQECDLNHPDCSKRRAFTERSLSIRLLDIGLDREKQPDSLSIRYRQFIHINPITDIELPLV